MVSPLVEALDDDAKASIDAQKQAALARIDATWTEATEEGIDPDILAHTALFTALAQLVLTFGEEPVADMAARLPERLRNGEFSLDRVLQ